jgi:outer membrane protein assembly factor BamE (lipoprotein component of BamABCDE complex)
VVAVCASIGLVVGVLELSTLDGVGGLLAKAASLPDTTEYARSYTDEGFARVSPGMTEDEVRELIGEPLAVDVYRDGQEEYWRYARSASDGDYHIRIVVFEESHVSRVISKYYFD